MVLLVGKQLRFLHLRGNVQAAIVPQHFNFGLQVWFGLYIALNITEFFRPLRLFPGIIIDVAINNRGSIGMINNIIAGYGKQILQSRKW